VPGSGAGRLEETSELQRQTDRAVDAEFRRRGAPRIGDAREPWSEAYQWRRDGQAIVAREVR
jgi:hypothetical protein